MKEKLQQLREEYNELGKKIDDLIEEQRKSLPKGVEIIISDNSRGRKVNNWAGGENIKFGFIINKSIFEKQIKKATS